MAAAAELPIFGELALAWLRYVQPTRVDPAGEQRQVGYLRRLFLETEETLSGFKVEVLIKDLREARGFGATWLNKIQATGRRIVRHAQKQGLWKAPNPFSVAERQKEVPREYELLTLLELARVQRRLTPIKRRLFRVALHTGLRPGELFALRKEDVDLVAGSIRVRRSHGRDRTKTGKSRLVPIVDAIKADLRKAMAGDSELVFPGPGGRRQRGDTKLTRALRTAMAAAGVGVTGALYWCCRPRLCGWREEVPGPVTARRCPRCSRRCCSQPRVKATRWYDLRHICATLHHQHCADKLAIALALGHTIKGTTDSVYTHPSLERLREELSRWHLP
jgi:integrase